MKKTNLTNMTLVVLIHLAFGLILKSQCAHPDDYAALRFLYLATVGDNWKNNTGWPTKAEFTANPTPPVGTILSNWNGVQCNNGRVSKVDLSSNNLSGHIPTDLSKMQQLQTFVLQNNKLIGGIPKDIGNLANLTTLNLKSNLLSSRLPVELSNLSDSCIINVQDNKLKGCFPTSFIKFCGHSFLSDNNPLLPWRGDFLKFCDTNGSQQMQIGAPCDNDFPGDGNTDSIQSNCLCGLEPCGNQPFPNNNSCGTAFHLGSGLLSISTGGNNTCAGTGGGCGVNSESAVYYAYTVPSDGITSLTVKVAPPHVVSVSTTCGGGRCISEEVIDCPSKGVTYYITVSSAEADEGIFKLSVIPQLQSSTITGKVYIDLNATGAFDGQDVGLQGSPVQLLMGCPGGSPVALTTSSSDGTYSFTNVPPGSYTVHIPAGAPGAPSGDPSPKNCCLIVDPCMPDAVLECDLGYPPPDCSSNPYSVDNICQDAYDNPLCDLTVIGQFACGQNPSVLGPWNNTAHCGGIYQNTSFYGFVAGTGSYQIQFTIFACAGSGVQYGLMDVCSPGGPYIICNGSANTGTVTVDASRLEPCKTYIFWIDGFSGSVCSYYISVTGDFNRCEIPPIVDLTIDSDCDPLCVGANGFFTFTAVGAQAFPAVENISNVEFLWDIISPDGSIINHTSKLNTVNFPVPNAGIYQVCVTTRHPCPGTSAPFCKTFVFEDLPPTSKEFKFCADDLPWAGEVDTITGEPVVDIHGNQWAWIGGAVTLDMIRENPPTLKILSEKTNECDCIYIQQLSITELGLRRDSFAICADQLPYTYQDTVINEAVTNLIYHIKDTMAVNGCDSIISLTINVLEAGEKCDDKDPKTINDVILENCECKGEVDSHTAEWNEKIEIKIIPNPSNGIFSIFGCELKDIDIRALDGRTITPVMMYKDSGIYLDLSAHPSGTYLLKVKHTNGEIVKKLVKL